MGHFILPSKLSMKSTSDFPWILSVERKDRTCWKSPQRTFYLARHVTRTASQLSMRLIWMQVIIIPRSSLKVDVT